MNIARADASAELKRIGAAGVGNDVVAVAKVETIALIAVGAFQEVIALAAGKRVVAAGRVHGFAGVEADDGIAPGRLRGPQILPLEIGDGPHGAVGEDNALD